MNFQYFASFVICDESFTWRWREKTGKKWIHFCFWTVKELDLIEITTHDISSWIAEFVHWMKIQLTGSPTCNIDRRYLYVYSDVFLKCHPIPIFSRTYLSIIFYRISTYQILIKKHFCKNFRYFPFVKLYSILRNMNSESF